jgi:hypothetical protein
MSNPNTITRSQSKSYLRISSKVFLQMCMQKISAANSCSGGQDYVTKGIVLGWLATFWDKQQGVFIVMQLLNRMIE